MTGGKRSATEDNQGSDAGNAGSVGTGASEKAVRWADTGEEPFTATLLRRTSEAAPQEVR